jgi:uncharacterized membrane protein YdjX (TVP38/TMEM64 family)
MIDKKRVVNIFGFLVILFTLGLFIFSFVDYGVIKEVTERNLAYYGLPAIFVAVFFFDLFPQYLSGHFVLIISAILKMNMLMVTVVTIIAAFLASVIGFWIGRKVERSFFSDLFGKSMYKRMEKGVIKYGKWYAAISAISPLPYIPIIFGAMDMSWKDFLIYGVIPRLVGFIVTVLFSYYALGFVLNFSGFG